MSPALVMALLLLLLLLPLLLVAHTHADAISSHDIRLAQLVHDIRRVRAAGADETAPEVAVAFDQGWRKRRDKEVKDRYEAFFQDVVRTANGTHAHAPASEGIAHVRAGDRGLWGALHALYGRSFVATRADWKAQLRRARAALPSPSYFGDVANSLQQQHKALGQSTDAEHHDDPPQRPTTSTVLMAHDAADVDDDPFWRLFNASHLPSHVELMAAFPWLDPAQPQAVFDRAVLELEDIGRDATITYHTPLDWVYFYSNVYRKVCEVWTVEYIEALASYLTDRLIRLGHDITGDLPVVEVGAGDGRLTYFLKRSVVRQLPKTIAARVSFMATDLGGRMGDAFETFPVERLGHDDAVHRLQPIIVLCSWMSMGVDLTVAFRHGPSVREYVLIGETDYGVSGTAVGTWGLTVGGEAKAAYAADGFERVELSALSVLQIARSDTPYVRFHSRTTSFRRQRAP